jgi:hypothetical protein
MSGKFAGIEKVGFFKEFILNQSFLLFSATFYFLIREGHLFMNT